MTNSKEPSRKALGRGLSSLIPANRTTAPPAAAPAAVQEPPAPGPLRVPIESIHPNPLQPRSTFSPEGLQELAQSIRENGIIQPLVVRRTRDGYQLVAGERRLRAARIAGLHEVPVVVQEFADDRLMEITLIENIQREDLNPIEVAHAFERLHREFRLSHEQIAQRTGKDRSTITNMLRLLRLPLEVQQLVAEQRLSMGHARALLSLESAEQQVALANKAADGAMSVRQVERAVQKTLSAPPGGPAEPPALDRDPNVRAAIDQLERVLGTRVRIVPRDDQRGRIEIEYYSQEDLARIYDLIVRE
ncbi:MAG: chromosome partitioning protein ParB [Bryobacteraceae bacterium]|jgi:ParB family chromosome partitioning protein|nr:MAG: chromosome partitioning protein ParB [Bryobacteraceae bacterium]